MDTAGIMGLLGRSGIYISPVHFAATYASATTLTLAGAGLPAITDDSQIIGVVEFPSGTARHEWKSAREYATSYAAGTLTMTGAAFANGSLFMVFVAGPHHLDADLAALLAVIQSAIEDHGTALSDDAVVKVGAEAVSGTPAALADGEVARLATNLVRSLGMHLTQGFDPTTHKVECWKKPGTHVVSGSTQISNAAATALSGTSIPCVRVYTQNRNGNADIAVGDSGIPGVSEGIIFSADEWDDFEVDDVADIYAYATNNNERLDWFAIVRS